MPELRKLLRLFLILSVVALLVNSCQKTDDKPDYRHFISKSTGTSYSKTFINSMIDLAVRTYPQLNEIKQYVRYDVDVYKVVYETSLNGKNVNASGLICLPSEPGEYPLLSFQNGTNTVNAYCPSNFITNPSYQLVEFMASMGFIVLFPDYPGFGESSSFVHPYLVKEPTVTSVVDMLYAAKEACEFEFPGIIPDNEVYLMGYSQGGWATLAVHKALEMEYNADFKPTGTVCGAGPYNLSNLFTGMVSTTTYPMPSYIGYIVNAYSSYGQFTNPVTDILNEPYAGKLGSLYTGTLSLDQINSQLTTSVSGLIRPEFLSGYTTSASYSSVRSSLVNNSIIAWKTLVPLYFFHGQADTQVSVTSTEQIYTGMITAGSAETIVHKMLFPGLDHSDGIVPCMTEGIKFLMSLKSK